MLISSLFFGKLISSPPGGGLLAKIFTLAIGCPESSEIVTHRQVTINSPYHQSPIEADGVDTECQEAKREAIRVVFRFGVDWTCIRELSHNMRFQS